MFFSIWIERFGISKRTLINELVHLWSKHQLHQKGISLPDEFIRIYKRINEDCWALYRDNAITKEDLRTKRFADTLEYFGILDRQSSPKVLVTTTSQTVRIERNCFPMYLRLLII